MFCIDLSFFIFLILDLSFELQSIHWVCFYFSQHVSGQIVSINLFKQFFAFILLKCVPAKANQQYRIRMQNSSVMRNVGCVGYVLYLLHSGKLSERLSSKTFFSFSTRICNNFLDIGNSVKEVCNKKYLVLIFTQLSFHCAKGGPWIYTQIEIKAHCATYGTPIVAN